MRDILLIAGGLLGVAAIPAVKAAIKAYRAKKSIGDIVVDGLEAGIEAVEKK